MHGTTIVAVRRGGAIALAGDGQVTMGPTIVKQSARKVRKLYQGKVLAGFAGSTADAITLFDLFEQKLEQFNGQLVRAAVELAKDWRRDRILRRLDALMIVGAVDGMFLISGAGDIIEPDGEVLAIGSGGNFALAAARALIAHTDLSARAIVEAAMHIASDICVYTNASITIEELS